MAAVSDSAKEHQRAYQRAYRRKWRAKNIERAKEREHRYGKKYRDRKRGGPPPVVLPMPDRFWAKVSKTDECWIWTASKDRAGYGRFGSAYAHRVAWTLTCGSIPNRLHVLHRCDNRACVRPSHLFLGTHQDNMADMYAKGRRPPPSHTKGVNNPNAKLSPTEVLAIRRGYANGKSQTTLATRYRMTQSDISRIVNRKTWRHI